VRDFAARVLTTDIRLHGARFVTVEFTIAACSSVALALTVASAAIVRGTSAAASAAGVAFFAGVAVNAVAVVRRVGRHGNGAASERASLRDLGLFCGATLLPGALAAALRPPAPR
jgi:hypothetical protein